MENEQSNSSQEKARQSLEERFKSIPADRLEAIERVRQNTLKHIDVFERLRDK